MNEPQEQQQYHIRLDSSIDQTPDSHDTDTIIGWTGGNSNREDYKLTCTLNFCRILKVNMWVILMFLLQNLFLCFGEKAALILARGGSKGVTLKNLQTVGGVSLLARAIQTAKLAGLDVTVSTDHPLIALEALKNKASLHRRSKITATDWSPSIWGAAEFVSTRPEVTILFLIQATSPFLRAEQLRKALNKINRYDCVFSVTRSFKLRWRDYNGQATPLNFKLESRPRRQDWNGDLIETGAFYISRRQLIESGYFQNNNCSVIEVSPRESWEVDSQYDLQVANALLKVNLE